MMQSIKEIPVWVLVGIPLVIGVVFGFAPRPAALQHELVEGANASTRQDPAAEVFHSKAVLAWEPWRYDLWEATGFSALQGGDPAAAISAFKIAESFGALSLEGRNALAEAYLAAGDWRQAISSWQKLTAAGEAEAGPIYQKILSQQINHEAFEDALATALGWVIHSPRSSTAAFQAGLLECVVHPAEAARYLDQALALENALASQVQTLKKALAAALQETHEGYQQVQVGRALANLGYWDLAEGSFLQATRLTPGYAEGWAFLGEALYHLDKDGTQELNKARSLDPNSIVVKALAALADRRNSRGAEAFSQLQQIAELQPGEVTWQLELGNTAAQLGDLYAALGYYQRATELTPDDPQTWLAMAEFSAIHLFQPREVGLPAARNALSLSANSSQALDVMGEVMLALEDTDSAERFLQQAIETDAGNAAAHLHLGQILLQKQSMEQAFSSLQLAVRLAGVKSETGMLATRLLERYFGGQ
jgi:tetratricopeptide (TPR) repeat protein